jgi:hypothetical protein
MLEMLSWTILLNASNHHIGAFRIFSTANAFIVTTIIVGGCFIDGLNKTGGFNPWWIKNKALLGSGIL